MTDANVVFAALITGGGTFRVFVTNRLLRNFRLIAPEYLFIEILEYFDEIVEKTKLYQEELEVVLNLLEEQIEIIPFEKKKSLTEGDRNMEDLKTLWKETKEFVKEQKRHIAENTSISSAK
ncbi:MAG: PIN domain-containing protein [Candidatus Jordarchaeaceae archaeon]